MSLLKEKDEAPGERGALGAIASKQNLLPFLTRHRKLILVAIELRIMKGFEILSTFSHLRGGALGKTFVLDSSSIVSCLRSHVMGDLFII